MKFSIGHIDWPLSNKSFAKFDLLLLSLNSLKCSIIDKTPTHALFIQHCISLAC